MTGTHPPAPSLNVLQPAPGKGPAHAPAPTSEIPAANGATGCVPAAPTSASFTGAAPTATVSIGQAGARTDSTLDLEDATSIDYCILSPTRPSFPSPAALRRPPLPKVVRPQTRMPLSTSNAILMLELSPQLATWADAGTATNAANADAHSGTGGGE